MKKINHYFLFLIAIIGAVGLQSCNDDDDNSPTGIIYPHTLFYSSITNVEFYMWTNGAEVNTSGLDLQDYLNEEDYLDLQPSAFDNEEFTFTEDSIRVGTGNPENYAYTISNDSIFVVLGPGEDEVFFFGTGSTSSIAVSFGLVSYCTEEGINFPATCTSVQNQLHYDYDSAADAMNIESINDIEVGDTLIVVNQTINFN